MTDGETYSAPSVPSVEDRLLLDYGVDTAKIMVRRIAHDFNNLIAVVRGYASVLQVRTGIDEDSRELVGLIEQAGSELAALTERMAQFADNKDHEFSWFNLNSVVLEFLEDDRDQAPQGIEVETNLGSPMPEIWGNARLIGDLCRKLWLNAIDSMPGGGRVAIKTSIHQFRSAEGNSEEDNENAGVPNFDGVGNNIKANGSYGQEKTLTNGSSPTTYLRLRVSDTGAGMDETTRANMLRPFYTTKAGKGRGLGTTIVYETVKSHGGHLCVSSEPGKGTCVDIYLPVTGQTEAQSPDDSTQSGETKRPILLVVDDDDMVRMTIQRMLAHLGYDSIPATSWEEALTLFEASRGVISGVILDVTMPGLGGVETFHRLRGLDTRVKIVIASGDMGSPAVRELRDLDVSYILAKPFTTDELSQAVRSVIE